MPEPEVDNAPEAPGDHSVPTELVEAHEAKDFAEAAERGPIDPDGEER